MFVVELIAFRWGTAKLAKLGIDAGDMHTHGPGSEHLQPTSGDVADDAASAHGPGHEHLHQHHGILHEHDGDNEKRSDGEAGDLESVEKLKSGPKNESPIDNPATQILGIAILEFGVLLHRCVYTVICAV